MAWQPPTMDQRREAALQRRAASQDALLATVRRLRVVGVVVGAIGVAAAVVGTPLLALTLHPMNAAVAVPSGIGFFLVAFGWYSWAIYKPLPKHLLASGVATPAVVKKAGMVGPQIETQGFGVNGTLMRHRYVLELRPASGQPYQVEIRTFDGPMMLALNDPPVTVYVDAKDPKLVCPDWSTLPKGA